MPQILREDSPNLVGQAVDLLRSGALLAYPTDTLYGLGAVARNEAAVRRLFTVKGRPPSQALPLLVSDPLMAEWVASVTPVGHSLMSAFWPGGLTIVMRRNESFYSAALAGGDTVALRAPARSIVLDIIHALGEPITGTSANRSGSRPASSAPEIAFQFGDMVALVIDGGAVRTGVESTILDITHPAGPVLVREGAVSKAELEATLGRPVA
jgi:L-threonylcarbamoyladenylate synthase